MKSKDALGYRVILASKALWSSFLILLLAGIAYSATMSYFSLWAVETFSISSGDAAVLFMITGISGIVVNPLFGLISDKFQIRRQALMGVLCIVLAAFLALSLIRSYALAIPFIALLGFGVIGPIMTIVGDYMQAHGYRLEQIRGTLAIIRQAWSIGYAIGPSAAALILLISGRLSHIFLFSAAVIAASVVILFLVRNALRFEMGTPVRAPKQTAGVGALFTQGNVARLILFLFIFVAIVFIWLPGQTRTVYLSLLVVQEMGLNGSLVGPLITVFSAVMTVMLPITGRISIRVGAANSMYISAAIGIAYCVLQSFSTHYWQLVALQVLFGVASAMWNTGTIYYLQECFPDNKGLADGFYAAVLQAPALFVGFLIGPVAALYGIRSGFVAAAILEIIGIAVLLAADRLNRLVQRRKALREAVQPSESLPDDAPPAPEQEGME